MVERFEVPPPLKGIEDEDGGIRLTRRELDDLLAYLERLNQYVIDNF